MTSQGGPAKRAEEWWEAGSGEPASLPVRLARMPAIGRLPRARIVELARAFKRRDLEVDERLYVQGEPGNSLCFVVSGLLRIERSAAGGPPTPIGRVLPDEFVGEMSVLDPAPRSASVIAATPAVVMELDGRTLRALERADPAVSSALTLELTRMVAARMQAASTQLRRRAQQSESRNPSREATTSGGLRGLWRSLVGGRGEEGGQ